MSLLRFNRQDAALVKRLMGFGSPEADIRAINRKP